MHVTELIGKRTRPFDCFGAFPADLGQPFEAGELESLLEQGDDRQPSSHRRPPSKGAQVAKIVTLALASCLLCASITIASMITHQRRAGTAAVAARPTVDISGKDALLPDQLDNAVPNSGMTGPPQLPAAPTNATAAIENPGPAAETAAAAADPPTATAADPRRAEEPPMSKRELVEHFYRLVPTWPDKAFALVDGTLLGTDLGKFVRSWSSVTDLQVLDVREQGDNVLAVVRMRLPDGGYLRVQQLFEVADTVPRRIVGAEILSAQRN